ncbi:amino acid transporter [Tuber magnatum]|uniref:Amino acid transporter n=1 Tax=Tuber magnatum TaxID=42249 RepID=A0A317SQW4_9PEZI|nr:amino acid transporter [Tuber magnatum]
MIASQNVDDSADDALAKMGYKAELSRNLSMISILGLSFAIMGSTTMYITLTDGQSVTIIWGWVLVSLISLGIAASLAEICSVFPTAGGVYYWSAMLSPRKYAPIASWVTGWLTLVGNWTVTTSINFSGGQLILSAIALWRDDWAPNEWQTILMFWCVMLVCALVNILGAKYLDLINKICIYWTAGSVMVITVTLLSMADTFRSGEFVFSQFDASASGWPDGWAFFVGLLQAAYTLTGYGMVASMCEEVQQPQREVPRAMVLSVAAAGVTGVVYLVPILFVLPDVKPLLEVTNGQPIGLLFKTVTGSASGGVGLLFLILGILLFAGIGALTAASRCTYAFARELLTIINGRWSKVDSRYDIPLWGLFLSTMVCCLLGLIYFGSTSYGLPILISLLQGRKLVKDAPYSLGKSGTAINILTICWICLAIVLFCMPVSIPVEAPTMNYASVVFAGFTTISAAWYFARGRKEFTGPPIATDAALVENTGSRADAEKS